MSMSHLAHHGPDHQQQHPTAISLAESVHCFRTTDRPRSSTIRAKFTTEERERVLGVRRQGACLRCRMLKIQVGSSPYPGTTDDLPK
jgi:hypothetical protein